MPVTDVYSGVILDQNATASGSIDWRGVYQAQTIWQEFHLPANYAMGTGSNEIRYPDLSGAQVLVTIDSGYAESASLDCELDYYQAGSGWVPLVTGTAIGCHTDGECWFDLVFGQPIPMTAELAVAEFRLGVTARSASDQAFDQPVTAFGDGHYYVGGASIQATLSEGVPFAISVGGQPGYLLLSDTEVTHSVQQGVSRLWYATNNPQGQAFQSDGVTPLLGAGTSASLNFRVLGLVADSGTDFLGNEYRSCVVFSSGESNAPASSTTTGAATTSGGNGTSFGSWTSTPQPSPFSVVSRYYDVRPTPVTNPIGNINLINDPGFEYDAIGGHAFDWAALDSSIIDSATLVTATWAATGLQSLRHTADLNNSANPSAGVVSASMPISPGATYSASVVCNVLSVPASSTGVTLSIMWYDGLSNLLNTTTSTSFVGLGQTTLTVGGATPGALSAQVSVVSNATGGYGTIDFLIDDVGFVTGTGYGDGDQNGWEWLGTPGQSASAQVLAMDPLDETTVIDGLLLDPITPNMAFNVYYSIDDSGNGTTMTERGWEEKLWTRVPQVYLSTQRQQYVFPQPVVAKYIKVEFTNLQARSYDPGPFPRPVTYKKFPLWVAEFFVAQLGAISFVANRVNVENDALTFAYDYYLDDLDQSPSQPVSAPSRQISTLTSYFSQSDAEGVVDASTLAQINTAMRAFQSPTGSLLSTDSTLGQYATRTFNQAQLSTPSTSETPLAPTPDYSAVSSSVREPVVFEQSMPVMYFFLTCRHTYKVLAASFERNLAYFAGVNDIQFLRHNYETTMDSSLYVESGGDTQNALVNDFVVGADQGWYTY